jgi:hypothetical protein
MRYVWHESMEQLLQSPAFRGRRPHARIHRVTVQDFAASTQPVSRYEGAVC